MVTRVLFGVLLYATSLATSLTTASTAAQAGPDGCCAAPPLPKVVYALPPVPLVVPPTGYVLDPSDAAKPVYVVTPAPHVVGFGVGFGIVPYARPTYSEGGYAYADAYPYDFPYVHSYGFGVSYR